MSEVTFQKSGITGTWTAEDANLLEFGEGKGIDLKFGCRRGNCTMCQQPLASGEVNYPEGHNGVPDEGNILLCCSQPVGDVVIDA
jgi:ferredoxin